MWKMIVSRLLVTKLSSPSAKAGVDAVDVSVSMPNSDPEFPAFLVSQSSVPPSWRNKLVRADRI